MYQQNASQVIHFSMVTTLGALDSFTNGLNVSINRRLGAGALTSGTGNLINSGGALAYVMTSADCNSNQVGLHFGAPGDVPASFTFMTTPANPYNAVSFGLSTLDSAVSTRLSGGDSRLNNLDATISSRLASADTRLNTLDSAISTRLSGGDTRLNTLDSAISTRLAGNASQLLNMDTAVSTRMATYAQPTGFLAATFPSAVGDATAASQTTINNNVSSITTLIGPAGAGLTGIALNSIQRNGIADAVLDRDYALGSDASTHSLRNATRFLRNSWTLSSSTGTLTVFKEDQATPAWTGTPGTTAGAAPVTSNVTT